MYSPLDCWKGYERVPGTKPGAKGSCRKSSPANFNIPFTSPMRRSTKGGGTTKVCLPQEKVNNMNPEQKKKVVAAKESAGRSGKRERSQSSEVKGAREKGATLKDWFEKENWVNVKTGEECGAPTKMLSPLNIKEEAYEKQNREMRKKHKKETGKTLGERQTTGTGSRRVSFACRFGSMAGSMTDKNGEPSKLAMALKKWGFSSKGEAKAFCSKNKES